MASQRTYSKGPGALYKWGAYAVRNKWKVLGGWLGFLIIFGVIGFSFGGEFNDHFSIPGADSQRAFDLLEDRFPSQSGETATIVFQSDAGIESQEAQIRTVLESVAGMDHVGSINGSPLDNPANISADGTVGYATVQFDKIAADIPLKEIEAYINAVDAGATDSLRIEQGGPVVELGEAEQPGGETFVALFAAAVVLLIAFGSIVAMGLPIITALVGLAAGFFGMFLITNFLDIATFTPATAAMIGIGVGIDYALFIVTRFREGVHKGLSIEESVARAMDTAGRSVLFAGIVVVIAVVGLVAAQLPFMTAYAVAVAIVVGFSIVVALTFLPALLGVVGHRIDKWGIKRFQQTASDPGISFGTRIGRRIQKQPVIFAVAAAAFLLALASPILDIDLGFTDAGALSTDTHARRAYDLLSEGFGPGFNNPFLVAVEGDGSVDQDKLTELVAALRSEPGIVNVNEPFLNDTGDVAVIQIVPAMAMSDDSAVDLVHHLRDVTIPAAMAGSNSQAYVGGFAATFVDVSEIMIDRTPLFFIIVVGLSFLLLSVVFRSIVIALKAAVMNLLSIAASFGVVVAIFQWGWFSSIIGVEESQPILVFMPMFLFSILFGLSMDYEVFLLSRIREAWVHGKSTPDAVVEGLGVTARVITAAAAIMVLVFLSFVLSPDPISKQMGVGLATAIFVDATIVRLILVPATMELLGEWNWWFPSWLDRTVPHVNVEGSVMPIGAEASAD